MRLKTSTLTLVVCLAATAMGAICPGQGAQNSDLRDFGGRVRMIDDLLGRYLNRDEISSVLTPGEVSSFPLNMTAGEVVVSEARSDAFDPALEIVDDKNKVVAYNDDRYPGDQRPLLFWRCDHDGAYSVRVRCFHDKSGGQFFFRYNLYNTVDAPVGQKVEKEIDAHTPILIRVPMKKGENVVPEIVSGGDKHLLNLDYRCWISPIGLPNYWLPMVSLQPAMYSFLAPVAGDYYELLMPSGTGDARGTISFTMREAAPSPLNVRGLSAEAKAPTGQSTLWEMKVKKDDLVQFDMPELSPNSRQTVLEAPDLSGCDLAKPETNPFYPQFKMPDDQGRATLEIPKRPGDNRLKVYHAWRDADIWIASNGDGPGTKQFTLKVSPAAEPFPEGRSVNGKLVVDSSDFWAFDAKAGDVLTLTSKANTFSQEVVTLAPNMNEIHHDRANFDQTTDTWQVVAEKPGQYLVHVSCVGMGGSGPYSLVRQVQSAKELSPTSPAKAEIGPGDVQVWRFTVNAGAPLLFHWTSSNWDFDTGIYKGDGSPTEFQHDSVGDHDRLGILRTPGTYLLIFSNAHGHTSYTIDLTPVPGFKKTTK